jgi:nucleoside-diphosphate-sugar epimerase
VDDEVDGIVRLLLAETSEDIHLPMNIGNPQELTAEDVAHKIIELTSSQSEICYEELPEDDPKVRRPDIGRAERLLGWSPRISLQQGLSKTIEYFRVRSPQPSKTGGQLPLV